ncbi:response regulator [Aquabacterium sp. J223]|uniref:response regulator n=1 Tax=Aquabacterium sp. J223 TaxID=2898431 RepID=UPI0021ADD57A|nr:response regulator [Aquabacterium sp. J223]UUX94446.1 response regulator [Aquabacterium sp. J223]
MKSVLVVEDEYGNAEVLQLLLESAGYQVRLTSNGREALVELARERPTLVLTDYMMPRMTGGELGLALRADPQLRDIPIVIMSATEESAIQSVFADYDAFLRKPYNAEQMLAVLDRLAESGRQPQAPDAQIDESVRQLLRGISSSRPEET